MDQRFIDQYDMLPAGARVLCAVSGGADSVCLLLQTLEEAPARGLAVFAAHYNHGLRGAESDRDEAFVRALCARLDVPCASERGDVAARARETGEGTEEAGRALRYAFLERAAAEWGCSRILTAHTADDNAETLLLNLARGAGGRGLGGIPPVRGIVARPMLTMTRAQVEEYLRARGEAHVEDASNGGDDYARNRVRHGAVPALRSVNAAFSRNASRAALLQREDEAFLESLARDFLDREETERGVALAALTARPRPLTARALRLMAGGPLTEKQTDQALALCGGRGLGYADVTGGRFVREQGYLRFGAEAGARIPPTEVPREGVVSIPEAGVELRCAIVRAGGEKPGAFHTLFFHYDGACGKILCTSRRDGDRIRLAGRGCTKRLSDLFTEAGLTQRQRDRTPVFRDEQGVAGVYGFGVAQRCAAAEGAEALRIEIKVGE